MGSQKKRSAEGEEEKASSRARQGAARPNILVTGTPGCGKTETCAAICARLAFEHVSITDVAAGLGAHEAWDEERQCHVLNEDAVVDALEPQVGQRGGCVVDYHAAEIFPERWFDLVLVLRCPTEQLYDRLQARGYDDAKLRENVECEIMNVVADEARESYDPDIVIELQNTTRSDLAANLDRVALWYENWQRDHPA